MPPRKGKKPVPPRRSCENMTQSEPTANSSTIPTSNRARNNSLKAKENEAIDRDIAAGRIEQLSGNDDDDDDDVPETQFEPQFEPRFEPQLPQLSSIPSSPRRSPSLSQLPLRPTMTESQMMSNPFCLSNDDSQEADPIEYGIHITIKYDNKILFSNTRWFEKFDCSVYNKMSKIEMTEVDKASTAKGRTKHQDGPWRVVLDIKKTGKTSTVANIGNWIDLLKVVNPLLVKKSATVMKIECLWSRVEATSPASSPAKRVPKRGRTNTIDDNDDVSSSLASFTDAGRLKARVCLFITL